MTADSNQRQHPSDAPVAYDHEVVLRDGPMATDAFQSSFTTALEEAGWDDAAVFAVRLSLEEALTNAYRHGNRDDPAKCVRVFYSIGPMRVSIAIEDEGTGFDPGAVPDPTNDANLEIPSGRGIMLIRAYMSSVGFVPPGNRLEMTLTRDV